MIYLIATLTLPFFINVLLIAISEGEIFGAWQRVLAFLYRHEKLRRLEAALGGCPRCFSNVIATITFTAIVFFYGWPLDSIILSVLLLMWLVSTDILLSTMLYGYLNRKKN